VSGPDGGIDPTEIETTELEIPVGEPAAGTGGIATSVGALLLRPPAATALYLFAHGAGAGMRHPFMEAVSHTLAARRIATLRYEFPYMTAGRRMPDRHGTLVETVRAAARSAAELAPDLPLFAGGKSMGGRMTSTAAAEQTLAGVQGIVFHGFPLHRPGDDSDARSDHLADVALPMLFLQGTRDRLAEPDRVRRVCERLEPRATLHVVEGADHGFSVLKRSGRTDSEVQEELADAVSGWIRQLTTSPGNG
jgi:predicted alpha/beta-hydrolase family hydrolase